MRPGIVCTADIMIPVGTALESWSVIACDQFSSEREYWDRVSVAVGSKPSALRLVLPEAYLGSIDQSAVASEISKTMGEYIDGRLFRCYEDSLICVERTLSDGTKRLGLVATIDLECYDYSRDAQTPVRASENTVAERLPARIEVRRGARLELPHVMAVIDDPGKTVVELAHELAESYDPIYDFKLMEGGGHVTGKRLTGTDAERVIDAICVLADQNDAFMVIGDGNHSLAAAKELWREIKTKLREHELKTHPMRYALLEINNIYDTGVTFEPIHRILFGADVTNALKALSANFEEGDDYQINWHCGEKTGVIGVKASDFCGFITKLQTFADNYANKTGCGIDYIHGEQSVRELSVTAGNLGLVLPALRKEEFFGAVKANGVFPKKSFSIGHARDKRYYLEARSLEK